MIGQVSDAGAGIAAHELPKVFEAFEQTSSGIASHKGTGLGLAITKHFLLHMNGDISLESEVGKGSSFTFHLPVKEPLELFVKQDQLAPIIGIKHPVRALVVDDSWENREVLCLMLDNIGFETKQAASGKQALDIYREWEPDIIMMDLMMPEMDGYETTRLIRERPNGKKTFIIAVTAAGLQDGLHEITDQGFDGLVLKPYKEKDILEAIGKSGIEYIFEDIVTQSTPAEPDKTLATVNIPPDLIDRIRQACLKARTDMLNEMLDDVKSVDPHAAKTIEELVNSYNYNGIIKYLALYEEKDHGNPLK